MFRNMSNEGHFSGGQSSTSPIGHGVASPGLDSQESSWIGLLSVVSRPALSFLHKYVTGRTRTPALSDSGPRWISADIKARFVDKEREILKQLDDMMPAPHLTYRRCQHEGAAGLLEPRTDPTLPWLTAESLRDMGIQSAEEMQTQNGHFSSIRTILSHVLLSSSQEIKPTAGKDWVKNTGGSSQTWWGSFWGVEEDQQKGPLDLSWTEEGTVTGPLCPQHRVAETKVPTAETTDVFVQNSCRDSTLGENTGPTDHKEEPANNGGLHRVQNTEEPTTNSRLTVSGRLSSSGAVAACSEVALLTPDQDNGYSSLEEEHIQGCRLCLMKPYDNQQEPGNGNRTEMEVETSEEVESLPGKLNNEEEMQEEPTANQEGQSAEATVLSIPQCQNKTIAFIMGCPCSDDDDSSQSESSDDDDDDDGFDSEGSSALSDSSDEDDEASDSDVDWEADRLWSTLCQSLDPYNPRNFTARLHTGSSPPRTIPNPTPFSSTPSTPASPPELPPSSFATSSTPPSDQDVWEDSTSASEADEAESIHLWSSFSCSSDPYSPLNFQAPLRTRVPSEASPRAKKTPLHSPYHTPAAPPEYRKAEAEERLDSGFSEHSSSFRACSTQSCAPTKKVRFCDDVEEFFASCGEEEEDRRGPWEELARDRCRFLRRCHEVEQSIAYCLQPQHRSLVYRRLTVHCIQDA